MASLSFWVCAVFVSCGAGGHFVELGACRGERLLCGAFAGAYGGVNGAPMAGNVSVFAGEVEGVFDGSGEFENGIESAGGNVAVRAVGEWVGLPVVSGATD